MLRVNSVVRGHPPQFSVHSTTATSHGRYLLQGEIYYQYTLSEIITNPKLIEATGNRIIGCTL